MRDVVLQMMTTLNGRVDDPDAWLTGVADEQYAEINRTYDTFDTVLVGRVTYEEMAAYWPGAENDPGSSDENRTMARRMNRYKKYMFTTQASDTGLDWNNSKRTTVRSDREIVDFVDSLKQQPGKDINLSGGARLAQTFVRLGLVDRYHLFVYPALSPGKTWYDSVTDRTNLRLVGSRSFDGGVIAMYYESTSRP